MSAIVNTKVGENRGLPRIWLEGKILANEGIAPNMKWGMIYGNKQISVSIFNNENEMPSSFDKTGSVSVRKLNKRDGTTQLYPVIEFRSEGITDLFEKEQNIKVNIEGRKITITPQKTASDIEERRERMLRKLKNNIPLSIGSAFHGGGVLDKTFHYGMKKGDVPSFNKVVIELEPKYLDASLRNNPEMFRKDSLIIQGGIENVDFFNTDFPLVDIAIFGIPCVGASIAGLSKNKLKQAEDHKDAGALFYYTLNMTLATNPAIIILENTKSYKETASMSVIRSVLVARGYELSERVMNGAEFGAIENRDRLCVVAMTTGMAHIFNLNDVLPIRHKEKCLGDVLDPIPLNSSCYKKFTYLVEKEKRDLNNGKGFKRQIVTPAAATVGVLGKGYAKARQTEPFLQHPENPELFRLFTPKEHARIKTIPVHMVEGCSDTVAHEILGQSVIFSLFYSIALHLAKNLVVWAAPMSMIPALEAPCMAMA